MEIPAALAQRFDVSEAQLVADTGRACVWRVQRHDGRDYALKDYRNGFGNEAPGADWMAAQDGHGCARIFDSDTDAILMEWLDGPSLGDLSRSGQDDLACTRLVAVAKRLHQREAAAPDGFPTLDLWFEDLFALRISPQCSSALREAIGQAQSLARRLLDRGDQCVLHGDLHHDNVIATQRGDCAFDAKGVVGDLAYELANAFRNPKGVPELLRSVARHLHLSTQVSAELGVDAQRMREWAAAKAALSIAWKCGSSALEDDSESDLLQLLLRCAEA